MIRPTEEELANTSGIGHTHPLFVGFLRRLDVEEKALLVKNKDGFQHAQGRCAMLVDILNLIDEASELAGDM